MGGWRGTPEEHMPSPWQDLKGNLRPSHRFSLLNPAVLHTISIVSFPAPAKSVALHPKFPNPPPLKSLTLLDSVNSVRSTNTAGQKGAEGFLTLTTESDCSWDVLWSVTAGDGNAQEISTSFSTDQRISERRWASETGDCKFLWVSKAGACCYQQHYAGRQCRFLLLPATVCRPTVQCLHHNCTQN